MVKHWYETDEFWVIMAPMMFGDERLVGTSEEVDHIIPLPGVQPGDTILDLCCGKRMHPLELARYGYQITGVDRTQAYLEKARRTARQKDLSVEFIQDDMRHFTRPEIYSQLTAVTQLLSTVFS